MLILVTSPKRISKTPVYLNNDIVNFQFFTEINVQIRKLTQQIEDAKTRTNSFMKDNDEKGDEIRDTLQSKERYVPTIKL